MSVTNGTDHKPVPDTLSIWEAAQTTDPNYTKGFKRTGGFTGTAINGTYLMKRATEAFGPLGIGWGYEILEERMLDGAAIAETNACEVIHCLRVRLWYKHEGETGEVVHFGQTTFVGKNKYGPYTDEEAPKKSLTDALTKCLSMLGFGADVHLGLYDDNKYVEGLIASARLSKAKARDLFTELLADMRQSKSIDDLTDWYKAKSKDISSLPPDWLEQLREDYKTLSIELKAPPALANEPRMVENFPTRGDYEAMIEDLEARLKAADKDIQAEIWESEIQPQIDDGNIFPPDFTRLRMLVKAA